MSARQLVQRRAALYQTIRNYFSTQGVLEVDLPAMAPNTITDVNIEPVPVALNGQTQWLQTSPEYPMKRLLAKGVGSIFSLCPVFRNDPHGRHHLTEFRMLEWYREHFDLTDLMADIERLIEQIAPNSHFQRHSYRSLMQQHLDIDPHTASARQLSSLARRLCAYEGELDTADALDLLFSVCIQPKLVQGFHLVFHYPRVQPGLALIADDERGTPVAKRVELFSRGLELGNGYHELLDADLLLARFNADNAELARRNKPLRPIDTAFLQAHRTGVPRCAGMALGIERLLMALDSIDDIRLLNPLHAG